MNTSPSAVEPGVNRPPEAYQHIGRVLGPAVFVLMLVAESWQQAMDPVAWRVAAVGLWMAIWWATEAIPVAVTAFLPLVVFDPLGVATIGEASAHYANPVIYLFLGGFLLALALERWNLHRRMALAILERTGTDGRRLVGGFMLVCALLSMWMTNTSCTMMLLPIVLSVIGVIRDHMPDLTERSRSDFAVAMLLGLAYAASIGGLATLIGTPPNALLAGYLEANHGIEISFVKWMLVGVPVSLSMLPLAWLVLTRVLFKVDFPESPAVKEHLRALRAQLGPMSQAERRVTILFLVVILCWMVGQPLVDWLGIKGVSDAGIVMTAAVLLFLMPSGDVAQPRLLTWRDADRLPWEVLVLFGGGLSLAAAVSDSGLALWLGESLAPLNAWGIAALVIASVTLVIFLTELTSNTATAATFLPVMGAIALQAGVSPLILTVPVTIAASCAFMLPVATPPNAIVYATGAIRIPQMAMAGLLLNLIGIVIISAIALFVVPGALR